MDDGEHRYLSYLLRLWQTKRTGNANWRASLEDPRTGKRRGFTSLESMVEYLRSRILEKENTQDELIEPK
jgi:hypothetical protein